jgi:zinc protease
MRRHLAPLLLAACASAPAPAPAPAPPPASAPAPAPAEPAYMTSAPALPEAKIFTPPAPATWTLPNGLPVVLFEKHSAPLVAMVLAVRAGGNGDPPGKAGLAALTADLLDEGAGARDALQLAEEIERLGAELTTGATSEASMVSLQVLSSRLPDAAGLLADVVLRPRFAVKDLERVRGERLARLAQRKVDPGAVAALAAAAAVYGDSPYGRPVAGYEKTIARLGVADVRGDYERFYHPNNAFLVVVGDTRESELRPMAERLFGAWKARPVPPLPVAQPAARPPRLVLVDKPGAAQSTLRIVEPAIPRADPGYAALQAAVTVLGGSFTSRLERNLREKHNYTYAARALVDWQRGAGPLIVAADVFTDVTADAVAAALHDLEALHGPFADDEVRTARALLRHRFVQESERASGLAHTIAALLAAGAPLDAYQRMDAELARLEAADLRAAAEARVHPERATIVLVGDLAKIRPGIEKLGLGAVEVRDADGLPTRDRRAGSR